jgi:hypothetical protein
LGEGVVSTDTDFEEVLLDLKSFYCKGMIEDSAAVSKGVDAADIDSEAALSYTVELVAAVVVLVAAVVVEIVVDNRIADNNQPVDTKNDVYLHD